MMTEEQLITRREQLVGRIRELEQQSQEHQRRSTQMNREIIALQGQVQLIAEQLGEVPAPPGAIETVGEDDSPKKPNAKPKPKRKGKAVASGR